MFKVWLHIEEIDTDGEQHGEPAEPVDLGSFARLEDAEAVLERLLDVREEWSSGAELGTSLEVGGRGNSDG
jgi:hypothetical protein